MGKWKEKVLEYNAKMAAERERKELEGCTFHPYVSEALHRPVRRGWA